MRAFKLAAGTEAVFTLKDRVADAAGKRGTGNVRFGGASLVAAKALGEIQWPARESKPGVVRAAAEDLAWCRVAPP